MIPILVKDLQPCAKLKDYVRKYQVFRFLFEKDLVPPMKHHYPRPEHCITFYPKEAQRFAYSDSEMLQAYPRCTVNGIYTVPVHRSGANDFLAIKVILKPTVLFQLLKFPLTGLTNRFIDAEDIWGNDVSLVCNRLAELDDLSRMMIEIENFLMLRVKSIINHNHPIDKVSNYILAENNKASVKWLADQSCLSKRQFIRKFKERIGISAKTYERIIRFDNAYRMKNCFPQMDWLFIALSCGYHDYQHMVKDFKEFSNLTPYTLNELESGSPERYFGLSYQT